MFRSEHAQIPGYPLVKDHWEVLLCKKVGTISRVNIYLRNFRRVERRLEIFLKSRSKQSDLKHKNTDWQSLNRWEKRNFLRERFFSLFFWLTEITIKYTTLKSLQWWVGCGCIKMLLCLNVYQFSKKRSMKKIRKLLDNYSWISMFQFPIALILQTSPAMPL